MSSQAPSVLKQAWYKWKSLRLPWRKTWLVGADLAGNTFWEFKDALNSNRFRRIVKYSGSVSNRRGGLSYADVKVSPQWHQWLRHTRDEAPSLSEQQYEISRQAMMKQLAAEADERWKSIPSYLDAPNKQQPRPAIGVNDPDGFALHTEPESRQGVRSAVSNQEEVTGTSLGGERKDEGRFAGKTKERKVKQPSPWDDRRPKGGPSENWQPESWTPGVAPRKQ